MAISFIANAADLGSDGGTGQSYTAAFTASALDSVLVIGVSVGHPVNGDEIVSVTYGAVAMTRAVYGHDNASSRNTYIYFLNNPPPGNNNFVITCTGPAAIWIAAGAAQYSGVAWLDRADVTKTTGTSSSVSSLSTSIVPINNNTWAIAYCEVGGGGPTSAGAGLTMRISDLSTTTWGLFDSNGSITPPASYSMTVNFLATTASEMSAITIAPDPATIIYQTSLGVNI